MDEEVSIALQLLHFGIYYVALFSNSCFISYSELMCEMHDMFITKGKLSCLNADRWVNNVVRKFVTINPLPVENLVY